MELVPLDWKSILFFKYIIFKLLNFLF
jgi:hypothetical protein